MTRKKPTVADLAGSVCITYVTRTTLITVRVLMNGNELGVKGLKLLVVVGTSMSKGFLDSGVPEAKKGRNILGQRLRPGVFKEKRIL